MSTETQTQAITKLTPALCVHCANPIRKALGNSSSFTAFCCSGCETVYNWTQNLSTQSRLASYSYLDDPEFLSVYAWDTPEGRGMDFYVEGVHCAACIQSTESLAQTVDHVGQIRLNLGTSVATVHIDKEGSFAALAAEIQKLGYRPHPIQRGENAKLQKQENRLLLIRLGVAGASAGNIMLLAVSLYGGVSGVMAERFRWISSGLFLPILLFSAVPFYRSAWIAIKAKKLSIDIPVVFGLLLGSTVSAVNLYLGDERIYFDSLSTLVFLLLSTRYLLKRAQQLALTSSHLLHFLVPSSVKKWDPSTECYSSTRLDQVNAGDRVQVNPGECIPIDGTILNGQTSLDCALLTGESAPQKVGPQDLVFAGTQNLDSPIEIQVTQSGGKTRVGRILDSMESLLTRKAPIMLFSDRVSHYFIAAVVLISAATFAWGFHTDWHEGLNRALAVSIVTCPCTFALITPLAFSLSMGKLAKLGVLVKGSDVLEKLTRIKSVFLDKTGTLTSGTDDQVRPDSRAAVQQLQSLHLDISIVSGDRTERVIKVAQQLGITPIHVYSAMSPEQKSELVQRHSPALMVGDGANDALALAQAFVSIAVQGGVEISLRAADVYLRRPGIQPIYNLMIVAQETLHVVKRNLAFSLIYNAIACGFALAGKIDPLFAAVLMPISAFTVFISSIAGTSRMRKALA